MRSLLQDPLWQPQDLGRAIPESPHAVSVCLPTWRDNIGYEEREPRVMERLRAGYPRFVYNPICSELFEHCRRRFATESELCHVYPTLSAADRFCRYFRDKSDEPARSCEFGIDDVHVVCFPRAKERVAKAYWQHSGEGISSRQARACLDPTSVRSTDDVIPTLRGRLAQLAGVSAENVCLFPSGMAATTAVLRAVNTLFPTRKTVQFGFPYVDTLKIQEKFGAGAHLFPRGGDREFPQLESLLNGESVGGVFTEFPSNPLLASPDLHRLSDLTRQHECPLIVDETVASLVNVDLLPAADVVCTSLTKYFSGVGDVMGGAVILNPASGFHTELSNALRGQGEELLWAQDLIVLEANSRDFEQRMHGINENAARLADVLREHPAIERVYYPQFDDHDAFRRFQRSGGGFGGLMSLTLRDPGIAARTFDALRVCKGPNLGMAYTLACPYTILAHYDELDFAEACGVSRNLIRLSVGLEEVDDLIQRFQDAFDAE